MAFPNVNTMCLETYGYLYGVFKLFCTAYLWPLLVRKVELQIVFRVKICNIKS